MELGLDGRRFAGRDEERPNPANGEDAGREEEIRIAGATYEES